MRSSCGLSLVVSPLPSVSRILGRRRIQRPGVPGRMNRRAWATSGRLPRLVTGRRPRRYTRLQSQVREDPLDHRRFQDRRNDLQLTAAVRAVRQVDLESEASAKTNLYSSYVAVKTRLSSLAQLSRTGRWCAQVASHSAGAASWARSGPGHCAGARWGCRPMACTRGARACDLGRSQAVQHVAIAITGA